MSLPRLADLLSSLDRETHAERCQRIVALARAGRGGPEVGQLLEGLAVQSDYHAVLAVLGAAVAGDHVLLERLAAHRAPRVARAAQARLPLPGSTESLAEGYLASSPNDRRLQRRRLAREGRRDVVDLLIGRNIADAERAGLLASASEGVAAAHLPDLADLVPNLVTLTNRHPQLVLAHLNTRLTRAPLPVRDHWWRWAGPALGSLIRHDPGAVLTLLESDGPSGVLTPAVERSLGALLRHDAERTAALITHPHNAFRHRLPTGLVRYAALLGPEDRRRIARHVADRDELLAQFLDALPPSERAEVFDAVLTTTTAGQRTWSHDLLEVLPRAVRHREVRRILALPHVGADVLESISLRGFLPADEAAQLLGPARHAADADERAAAYAALVQSASWQRDPHTLATTFEALDDLRNERDPVRQTVAAALADIPGWLLVEAGLARVEAFATAAATARDCSPGTLHALQSVAWRAIRQALESADLDTARAGLRMVDTLTGPTGLTWIPSLTGIRHGGEQVVIDALAPRLQTAAGKDDYRLLFTLCQALGERGWGVTVLDDFLRRALRAPSDATVRRAAELWLDDPATRAVRVGEALRIDESIAVLDVVQQTLIRRRQDLLGVLWKRKSLGGRLWGRQLAYVPIVPGPFTRWPPRQITAYAAALTALVATPSTATWTATSAIRTLGRLPEVGLTAVEPYLADPDLARREAALAALAWTDRPTDALEQLLAVRSGDEVRVAMYAAGRCLRDTPGRLALPMILDVLADPAAKVTARKEAVRLLGLIRVPAALDHLIEIGLDDSTQRDVRFAVARTVRGWLDDERSWQVLGAVADSGREGARSIAETEPTQIPERHRTRYARLLLPGADVDDPTLIAALARWAPWLPEAMSLLCSRIAALTSPNPQLVASAILEAARHGAGVDPLIARVRAFAAQTVVSDHPGAGQVADQPVRQRLSVLALTATDLPPGEVADHRATLLTIAGELAPYGDLRGLAIMVAARAVDWDSPLPGLEIAMALVDEPLRCADVRAALDSSLARYATRPAPSWIDAVDALLSRDELAAGVSALSLVAWAGPQTGWNALWRERIGHLRGNTSRVLSTWARDVVTGPPTVHAG